MVENIADKGVDGVIVAENSFHLSKLSFALFDNLIVGMLCHNVIFGINHLQGRFVKIELDYTAFIVNRTCSTVLNSLCHIIYVDIISEYLTSATVFRRNRCTRKADICSIRKCITNNTSSSYFNLTGLSVYCFGKSILTSVCFISHNYNIVAFR